MLLSHALLLLRFYGLTDPGVYAVCCYPITQFVVILVRSLYYFGLDACMLRNVIAFDLLQVNV